MTPSVLISASATLSILTISPINLPPDKNAEHSLQASPVLRSFISAKATHTIQINPLTQKHKPGDSLPWLPWLPNTAAFRQAEFERLLLSWEQAKPPISNPRQDTHRIDFNAAEFDGHTQLAAAIEKLALDDLERFINNTDPEKPSTDNWNICYAKTQIKPTIDLAQLTPSTALDSPLSHRRNQLTSPVMERLKARIHHFLMQRYSAPTARLSRADYPDGDLNYDIDTMRGVVIENPKRWERLELSIIISTLGNNPAIHLVLDGYLASGSPDKPPPLGRYTAVMSRDYPVELNKYLGRLGSDMKRFLEDPS